MYDKSKSPVFFLCEDVQDSNQMLRVYFKYWKHQKRFLLFFFGKTAGGENGVEREMHAESVAGCSDFPLRWLTLQPVTIKYLDSLQNRSRKTVRDANSVKLMNISSSRKLCKGSFSGLPKVSPHLRFSLTNVGLFRASHSRVPYSCLLCCICWPNFHPSSRFECMILFYFVVVQFFMGNCLIQLSSRQRVTNSHTEIHTTGALQWIVASFSSFEEAGLRRQCLAKWMPALTSAKKIWTRRGRGN
jgi:hypothetical protein